MKILTALWCALIACVALAPLLVSLVIGIAAALITVVARIVGEAAAWLAAVGGSWLEYARRIERKAQ